MMKRPSHLSRDGWEGCWKSSMDSWRCGRCIVGDRYLSFVLSLQFEFIASGCLVGPLTPHDCKHIATDRVFSVGCEAGHPLTLAPYGTIVGANTWPFRPWDYEVCIETSLSFGRHCHHGISPLLPKAVGIRSK